MNLLAFGPEIIIISFALIVLIADLFIPKKYYDWLGYISLAGLIFSLAYASFFWTTRGIVLGTLTVDELTVLLRYIIIITGIMINLAAIKNTSTIQQNQGEFFSLLLFSLTGAMILTGAKGLITLYLGLELSTIPMYVLVIFRKDKAAAGEAAIKYFLLGIISSIFLLYGLSLIYGITGHIDLAEIAKFLSGGIPPVIVVASLLAIVGFGFKITIVPFHFWAPDTYEGAPLVVVAYLATVLKLGAFAAIARFFVVAMLATKLNWPLWFGTLAIITMTLGNVMALPQRNIKRMMAYSGIAHVGYPLIGLALGTKLGISALFFYLITYSFSTIGVFFVMYARSAKKEFEEADTIDGYTGFAQTNPALALIMTVSFLSLIGFPPMAGFFGKLYLILATIAANKAYFAVFLIVNSVLSFAYYSKVIKAMYLDEAETKQKKAIVQKPTIVALSMATIAVMFLGIFQRPLWHYAIVIFNNIKFK